MPEDNPRALEKVSGSALTEGVLAGVAAWDGGMLAALLPVLAKYPAAQRQRERAERSLGEVHRILSRHEAQLKALTDPQYKLLNEVVITLLQTTDEEKLALLKAAVSGVLTEPVSSSDSYVLSRVLRDISVEEILFLKNNFRYTTVQVVDKAETTEEVLRIKPGAYEERLVNSLTSLSMLENAGTAWDTLVTVKFSPYVAKLLTILDSKQT